MKKILIIISLFLLIGCSMKISDPNSIEKKLLSKGWKQEDNTIVFMIDDQKYELDLNNHTFQYIVENIGSSPTYPFSSYYEKFVFQWNENLIIRYRNGDEGLELFNPEKGIISYRHPASEGFHERFNFDKETKEVIISCRYDLSLQKTVEEGPCRKEEQFPEVMETFQRVVLSKLNCSLETFIKAMQKEN